MIDLKTREIYGAVITPWFPKVGGKWVRVFQNATKELLVRSPGLHGQSTRVLLYLTAAAGWDNAIPSPPALAKELFLNEKTVYRAYAELIRAEFVIKRDGAYYLSPLYCWKGDPVHLEQACRELLPPVGLPVLPEPAAPKVGFGNGCPSDAERALIRARA